MKKFYSLYYSVKCKNESKIVIIKSNNLSLNKINSQTSALLNSIRLSPSKEVINKILKFADS